MAVDVAYDGASGLEKVTVNGYDVVVLDRDLPRLHGDELCAQIISSPCGSRILMLTAAGQVEDRVDGLNLGADDYLAKPFDFAELVARVRALARRSPSAPPVLTRGDLVVDRIRRTVMRAGRPVLLARKELGILEVLVSADGGVVSSEQLLEQVWDEHADPFTNTVAVTVLRLRRKLGEPPLVETVIGGGYRIP
jgi:DNA-binding response OmpR family regulator